MKVHVLNHCRQDFVIHAVGCADIEKQRRKGELNSDWILDVGDVKTRDEVAVAVARDISEGFGDEEGNPNSTEDPEKWAWPPSCMRVMPCVHVAKASPKFKVTSVETYDHKVGATPSVAASLKSIEDKNNAIVCTRCGGQCHGLASCDANIAAKTMPKVCNRPVGGQMDVPCVKLDGHKGMCEAASDEYVSDADLIVNVLKSRDELDRRTIQELTMLREERCYNLLRQLVASSKIVQRMHTGRHESGRPVRVARYSIAR